MEDSEIMRLHIRMRSADDSIVTTTRIDCTSGTIQAMYSMLEDFIELANGSLIVNYEAANREDHPHVKGDVHFGDTSGCWRMRVE